MYYIFWREIENIADTEAHLHPYYDHVLAATLGHVSKFGGILSYDSAGTPKKRRRKAVPAWISCCAFYTNFGIYYISRCLLYSCKHHPIINTSYEKLPFGSGDDPDKLLFHQALN